MNSTAPEQEEERDQPPKRKVEYDAKDDWITKRRKDLQALVETASRHWWPLVAVVLLCIVVYQQNTIVKLAESSGDKRMEDMRYYMKLDIKEELAPTKEAVRGIVEETREVIQEAGSQIKNNDKTKK